MLPKAHPSPKVALNLVFAHLGNRSANSVVVNIKGITPIRVKYTLTQLLR